MLSHLGSAAEICTELVRRGATGDTTAPTPELTRPIWARWDALPPASQRAAWHDADVEHRELLAGLDHSARIPYFAGLLDLTDYAGYRLSEQSVHGWDVEVASDPAARIPPGEAALLWERLDLVASRFHDAGARGRIAPAEVSIGFTDAEDGWWLDVGQEIRLRPGAAPRATASAVGPAETLLRLVYGRRRPTDDLRVDGALTAADLGLLFPGY